MTEDEGNQGFLSHTFLFDTERRFTIASDEIASNENQTSWCPGFDSPHPHTIQENIYKIKNLVRYIR